MAQEVGAKIELLSSLQFASIATLFVGETEGGARAYIPVKQQRMRANIAAHQR